MSLPPPPCLLRRLVHQRQCWQGEVPMSKQRILLSTCRRASAEKWTPCSRRRPRRSSRLGEPRPFFRFELLHTWVWGLPLLTCAGVHDVTSPPPHNNATLRHPNRHWLPLLIFSSVHSVDAAAPFWVAPQVGKVWGAGGTHPHAPRHHRHPWICGGGCSASTCRSPGALFLPAPLASPATVAPLRSIRPCGSAFVQVGTNAALKAVDGPWADAGTHRGGRDGDAEEGAAGGWGGSD